MILIEKLSPKQKNPSKEVEIVLLGLTPGKQQHKAIDTAKNTRDGAFKGYMRKQIFQWFSSLGIAKYLDLATKNALFQEKRFLKRVYMTSLLREPVYIKEKGKKKNYTGRSPYPWQNKKLKKMMDETMTILKSIKKPILIVPMGQIVSIAIRKFSSLDKNHFILHGLPHPSGANVHRKIEFEKNRKYLKEVFETYVFIMK